MATPRSEGGVSVTSAPSMAMRPEVVSSRPAISRSKVDLPQPDGPTKTTNSPLSTSRSTEWMTASSPKLLPTLSSFSPATLSSRRPIYVTGRAERPETWMFGRASGAAAPIRPPPTLVPALSVAVPLYNFVNWSTLFCK
ncbi:hypothetical protein KL86PLE_30216 [uncultured Pleomorphomonas sp.]|uniref:Uncharacterized protein n=1 Tax=uncultured Pleomorphomonas sp. TaxID=442121 RepID=A0A212LEG6_9HYPH|nr:hypothetical protein KL86PLE_30216 [uncultured Pleomorphomonas sp.]